MKEGSAVPDQGFCLEEATIDELHHAIILGRTTCVAVVRHYLGRVRAFNGVASMLVTEEGGTVLPVAGAVRGGRRLAFPTHSVKASEILPDLDRIQGTAVGIRPHGSDRL
jgi:amidase